MWDERPILDVRHQLNDIDDKDIYLFGYTHYSNPCPSQWGTIVMITTPRGTCNVNGPGKQGCLSFVLKEGYMIDRLHH